MKHEYIGLNVTKVVIFIIAAIFIYIIVSSYITGNPYEKKCEQLGYDYYTTYYEEGENFYYECCKVYMNNITMQLDKYCKYTKED